MQGRMEKTLASRPSIQHQWRWFVKCRLKPLHGCAVSESKEGGWTTCRIR